MRDHGISIKRIIILLIILVFFSMAFSVYLIINFYDEVKTYRNNVYRMAQDSCIEDIETKEKNLSLAMDITALNPIIRDNIFRQDVSYLEMAEIGSDMRSTVSSITYLLDAGIFDLRYAFYTYLPGDGRNFLPLENMMHQEWYEEYMEQEDSKYVTYLYDSITKEHKFVIIKAINDFNISTTSKADNPVCYQAMTIGTSAFFNDYEHADINTYIYLFTKSGKMVYGNNEKGEEAAKQSFNYAVLNNLKELRDYVPDVAETASPLNSSVFYLGDVDAYCVIMFDSISAIPDTFKFWLATGMVLCIFFVLVMLLWIFYFSYQKRINKLVLVLDNFDENLMVNQAEYSQEMDEISRIGNHVALMQGRIKNLIEEEYEIKMQNLSVQYEALTTFINPHFLYNTLNSISAMATIEDAENTNKMILALSDMFKYSSEISVKVVSLKEELSNIESYLYIQSIRYEDNFVYHVDVKDELLNCAVPKLILQPLVENCFKHGFGKRKAEKHSGQNEIIVCAVKENERLKVYVMDNGAGMTDKRLKEIQESLNGADTEKKHDNGSTEIGLSNVNKRLKLFYGEEYGVSVSCKRGNYTCVEITLIYAENKDEMNGELRKHF